MLLHYDLWQHFTSFLVQCLENGLGSSPKSPDFPWLRHAALDNENRRKTSGYLTLFTSCSLKPSLQGLQTCRVLCFPCNSFEMKCILVHILFLPPSLFSLLLFPCNFLPDFPLSFFCTCHQEKVVIVLWSSIHISEQSWEDVFFCGNSGTEPVCQVLPPPEWTLNSIIKMPLDSFPKSS